MRLPFFDDLNVILNSLIALCWRSRTKIETETYELDPTARASEKTIAKREEQKMWSNKLLFNNRKQERF